METARKPSEEEFAALREVGALAFGDDVAVVVGETSPSIKTKMVTIRVSSHGDDAKSYEFAGQCTGPLVESVVVFLRKVALRRAMRKRIEEKHAEYSQRQVQVPGANKH